MARRTRSRSIRRAPPPGIPQSAPPARGWARFSDNPLWAIGVLVVVTLAVYSNSFSGAFVYDDVPSILGNRTIRQLWPPGAAFSPPLDSSTMGRPLLNFSFALNYALGGLAVQGYHVLNLAIHVVNALLLFGIVRRTLGLPMLREKFGDAAVALAFSIALLWAVHPLQTESVTYIVQRAESLVSLFYLLTLYCVIRGAGSGRPVIWHAAAVLSCLLGMGAKEVMVTAPVVVVLYDRTFLAGSFREALLRRRWLYTGLGLTWILLAYLVASAGALVALYTGYEGPRGSSDTWTYAATEPGVILHYLRLSVWPHPLVLDYGWPAAKTVGDVLPAATAIAALVAVTLWGLIRRSAWSFAAASFFLILSPTSSVVPLTDEFIYEHRMYLALAVPLSLIVLAGYARSRALVRLESFPGLMTPALRTSVVVATAALLGIVTFQRNKDYANELSFWTDTASKAPHNSRAQLGLGKALAAAGHIDEAIAHYREALRLKPDYPEVHNNLGTVLAGLGSITEAIAQYREALRLKPGYEEAHYNLGKALAQTGQLQEAIAQYREALRLRPASSSAHNNLGNVLAQTGRYDEAISHFQETLRLNPAHAGAQYNWANALLKIGRTDEAVVHYREALRLNPNFAEAHNNLGAVLLARGAVTEAKEQFRDVLRIKPDFASAKRALDELERTGQR